MTKTPAVIGEGLATVMEVPDIQRWHDTLIFTLVEAVERHPGPRREEGRRGGGRMRRGRGGGSGREGAGHD